MISKILREKTLSLKALKEIGIYAVHETDMCVGLPEIFFSFYLKLSKLKLFLKMRQQNDSQSSH